MLQEVLSTRSIKINKNGQIELVFRYKPDIIKNQNDITDLEDKIKNKLNNVTGVTYRIINLQKQPAFSYNVYARLLSSSSSVSQDRIKRYLNYFKKDDLNRFTKTSYAEIYLTLIPSSVEKFKVFLSENH